MDSNGNNYKYIRDYKILNKIGKGSFSRIKRVEWQSENFALKYGHIRAMKNKYKTLQSSEGKRVYRSIYEYFINEVNILQKLNHPNIVKFYEYFEENGKAFIVLEFLSGGPVMNWNSEKEVFEPSKSLSDRNSLDSNQIKKVVKDIANALKYIHSIGIIHRDLKPENILQAKNGDFKLCDFNVSCHYYEAEQLQGTEGTMMFMPPEILKKTEISSKQRFYCDNWSFGITIYCLIFHSLPFKSTALFHLVKEILEFSIEHDEKVIKMEDLKFKMILINLLQKELAKRWTAELK